ncbi:MAG: CinA family nicotinamide mononucleotide deamidase-related protein [Caldilineaceae bacterium]|nr:CinA family nicotinamide mononucleotide deamidase-related protein [Caldilineaceae bacterium]MCB9137157.1 CinA family nicotinamide mononucleotide deamidase-related protein [Caldilineaceae bacterium]
MSSSNQSARLNAEIITTGTEILLGEIVDTNAAWIAQQLRDVGVNLYYKSTVGDNLGRVVETLGHALQRSDIVIVTGGLGPTVDDITRDAIAQAVGQPLVRDERSLDIIRERFAQFGVAMTANNERQAMVPAGATVIDNPVGTAPAFRVEKGRTAIIALPGVPREMEHLMTHAVLPYLRARSGNTGVIQRRILRTIGIGESTIDSRLEDLMQLSNPTVGLAAHTGQADVRITAGAANEIEADRMLDELESRIRERIGRYIYSTTPKQPFPEFLIGLLEQRGATVGLVEVNTNGRLAQDMHEAAGDADPLIAAWTEDSWPGAPAGDSGATGEAAAEALAVEARGAAQADYGLALLNSATNDGTAAVALAGPNGVTTRRLTFPGQDTVNLQRAANQAMVLLWRGLNGVPA